MVSPASAREISALSGAAPVLPSEVSGVRGRSAEVAQRISSLLEDSQIRFQDFEMGYEKTWAFQDYANAFSIVCLVSGGFSPKDALALLQGLRGTGIPSMTDYFCIKYLGNGASMSSAGFENWNVLSEKEKDVLRDKFRHEYLEDLDWESELVLKHMNSDTEAMNRLMRDFWPEGRENANSKLFLGELSVLATRALRRLRALGDEASLQEEINECVRSRIGL